MKEGLNLVDAAVGAILLMGMIGGIRRGLSGEIWRVLAFCSGAWVAWRFSSSAAAWCVEELRLASDVALIGAAAALFTAVLLIFWITGRLLKGAMSLTFKGKLDRIGGGFCGLARAAVIASFLLLLAGMVPHEKAANYVRIESLSGRLCEEHLRPRYEEFVAERPTLAIPHPDPSTDGLGEVLDEATEALDPR